MRVAAGMASALYVAINDTSMITYMNNNRQVEYHITVIYIQAIMWKAAWIGSRWQKSSDSRMIIQKRNGILGDVLHRETSMIATARIVSITVAEKKCFGRVCNAWMMILDAINISLYGGNCTRYTEVNVSSSKNSRQHCS